MVRVAAFKIKEEETSEYSFTRGDASSEGKNLLPDFVVNICGCAQDWDFRRIYRCFQ